MSNNSSRKLHINIEISGTECVTFGAELLAIAGLAVEVIPVLGHVGAVHHLLAKSWVTSHETQETKRSWRWQLEIVKIVLKIITAREAHLVIRLAQGDLLLGKVHLQWQSLKMTIPQIVTHTRYETMNDNHSHSFRNEGKLRAFSTISFKKAARIYCENSSNSPMCWDGR